jgi:S1-C subfamily serine protease
MFIGLLIFFITAGALTALVKQIPRVVRTARGGVSTVAAPRASAGVDKFETADGDIGATFKSVRAGAPADKAGLVGGDIITTIDGVSVHSDDDMTDILRQTPIGKPVDVVYIRDGETKNTKLTRISEEELEQLEQAFIHRPEGLGRFGYDDDETERVEIPGTKIFGVRLDEIEPSLPADMAGIKNGDIVIEFGGIPIRTPEEFRSRVRRAIPYKPVDVVIMRDGERLTIPVKLGKLS